MNNIMDNFEKQKIRELTAKKNIPNFRAGDTIKVNVKVVEGQRSRIQSFEGICIAKKNAGLSSSCTVRKISYGEGIERIFPFFSNIVDSIEVIKQGDVRRAKLYYLRKRSGKSTRIADKNRGDEKDQYELTGEIEEEKDKSPKDNEASNEANNIKESKKEEAKAETAPALEKKEEKKEEDQKSTENKSLQNGDKPKQ